MPTTTPRSHVQLSQRVQQLKPSATLAVAARVAELCAAGADIVAFGAGEPDFDTPQPIKQAAIDALLAGCTHYMPVAGDPASRQAVAEKLQRDNDIACEARDIIITVGAKHAIYLALQSLIDADAGHEVVLPSPAWVSYAPMIELAGGIVREVPASVDDLYLMSPEQLAGAITPRTRAIMMNSPSNPTGAMYSTDQWRALAEVIEAHPQVILISDEIYEKIIFGDIPHFSPGSIDAIADRVITVNGLSKAHAMTGWRVGYACAPQGIAAAMTKLMGQMTSNITSFLYPAIVEALTHGDDDVECMRQAFASRCDLMHERVSSLPGVICPKPGGAFYLFPDFRAVMGRRSPGGRVIESSLVLAEALLEEAQVAVVPGEDFGASAASCVRLSFACSEDRIIEGCERMAKWAAQIEP